MSISIDKYVAPVQELAALNAANFEKLVDLQLQGVEEIADASVDSLKQAVSVKDLEGFKSYSSGQAETVKSIYENAFTRSKSAAEIVQSYPASIKKIVDNSLATS